MDASRVIELLKLGTCPAGRRAECGCTVCDEIDEAIAFVLTQTPLPDPLPDVKYLEIFPGPWRFDACVRLLTEKVLRFGSFNLGDVLAAGELLGLSEMDALLLLPAHVRERLSGPLHMYAVRYDSPGELPPVWEKLSSVYATYLQTYLQTGDKTGQDQVLVVWALEDSCGV